MVEEIERTRLIHVKDGHNKFYIVVVEKDTSKHKEYVIKGLYGSLSREERPTITTIDYQDNINWARNIAQEVIRQKLKKGYILDQTIINKNTARKAEGRFDLFDDD
jgi:hypothetical protein